MIPSPSPLVKIQIMCRKVCLRCNGKILLAIANNLLKISLLTSSSNVLPYYLKSTKGRLEAVEFLLKVIDVQCTWG